MAASEEFNDENFILSMEDVNHLLGNSSENKIDVTNKIASYYKSGGFDSNQMQIAQDIFRLLVKDTETSIRQALSESLKDADNIPKEIILDLAQDIEEVSLPVVQFSNILTDADLIDIVNSSKSTAKQVAIAKRDNVSENLSNALINTSSEEVVGTLLDNNTANVSVDGYSRIVDQHGNNEQLLSSLVERDQLPVRVIEHLASAVSDAIYEKLSSKHTEIFDQIDSMVSRSREVVTMKVIGLDYSEGDFNKFMELMEKKEISSETMPLYALAMGNLPIFEVCMSRLTKLNHANIKPLVRDQSNKGIRALFTKAHLPEDSYAITELMLDVIRSKQGKLSACGLFLTEESTKELIEAIKEKASFYEKMGKDVSKLDYVLSIVDHTVSFDSETESE